MFNAMVDNKLSLNNKEKHKNKYFWLTKIVGLKQIFELNQT